MSIDSDVFDVLVDLAGEGHVFPMMMPLRTKTESVPLPAIVYQRITKLTVRSHDGDELLGPLYQFTCWAATPTDARALAREVAAEWASRIGEALVENDRDHYDPEQRLFARIVDVRVWAREEEAAS